MSRTQKQRRAQPRLPSVGTVALSHDDLTQWRLQATWELQLLQLELECVIGAMRRDMYDTYYSRYSEVNK